MTGKVAIITGSTSGIGQAIAHYFAARGARVVIHGRDRNAGEQVLAEIRQSAGEATMMTADITSPDACEALVDHAVEHFGALDILVNNAGRNIFTGTLKSTLEDWQTCLDTDLRASWLCAKAAARHMPHGSAIVNVASNHAAATIPGCFPYNVAKAGVLALSQSLALELAPQGIRVNTICPGYIDTPINDRYFGTFADPTAERQRVERLHPLGRIGRPEDVAKAARFLALEEESGFITGTHLTLDGGRSALLQDPS